MKPIKVIRCLERVRCSRAKRARDSSADVPVKPAQEPVFKLRALAWISAPRLGCNCQYLRELWVFGETQECHKRPNSSQSSPRRLWAKKPNKRGILEFHSRDPGFTGRSYPGSDADQSSCISKEQTVQWSGLYSKQRWSSLHIPGYIQHLCN